MIKHFIPEYFAYPEHPITVNLVGAGGTGSHVLHGLAGIHYSLRMLNHPGLYVRVIDGDKVSPFNVGRQRFSPLDSQQEAYKASVLVSRINSYFGTAWEAINSMMERGNAVMNQQYKTANVLITCVDSGKARKQIIDFAMNKSLDNRYDPDRRGYYWMDFGNSRHTGQVVLGSLRKLEQPKRKGVREWLPAVDELFPQIFDDEGEKDETSCSMREALLKQDLFINQMLATWGQHLLWQLFTETSINLHGYFLNMKSGRSMPILLK